jgi:hypothetical protein
MQASALVGTVRAHPAGGADVAGGEQPHAREGDTILPGQPLHDAIEHPTNRALLGDGKDYWLQGGGAHARGLAQNQPAVNTIYRCTTKYRVF